MDIAYLIELVRENPILYVTSHPAYARTKLKEEIWEKIGTELRTNGKAVKEQWQKLRECHREALRRQKKKLSEGVMEPQKPWIYQHQMEFLLPFMKNRPVPSTFQDSTDTPNNPYFEDGEDTKHFARGDESPPPVSNVTCDDEIPPAQRVKNLGKKRIHNLLEFSGKRTAREEFGLKTYEMSCPNQNEALYHFFQSMLGITLGLPYTYQRQIRNKLYEIVTQAEQQHANETKSDVLSRVPSSSFSPVTAPSADNENECETVLFDSIKTEPTPSP